MGEPDLLPAEEPISNTFVWPPPTSEAADDILWLEPEPDRIPAPTGNDPAPVSEARDDGGVPISYLLSAGIHFEWQDVVALVQELGAQLKNSQPSGTLLALEAITLDPDGRLRVRLDTGTIPIVRSLGQVLHQLLTSTPSPANLRLVALQANSETPTFLSVEDLRSALAKFERPGRRKALAALYERARQATSPPVRVPEPEKVEQHAERPLPAIVPEPQRQTGNRLQVPWRLQMAAVVLVATVSMGFLIGTFVIREGPQPTAAPQAAADPLPASPASDSKVPGPGSRRNVSGRPSKNSSPERSTNRVTPPAAQSAVGPTGSAALVQGPAAPEPAAALLTRRSVADTAGVVRQPAASRVPGNAEEEFRRARALFDRKEYAAAATGFQRVITILSNGELSPSSSTLRSNATEMAALSRAALSSVPDTHIYTALDKGVVQPVPWRPYFPEEAALGGARNPSVLEILIDTEGAVESVRLRNPQNRYRDKWWLPAAKTWRFHPALKDGQPVKFLKRIVINALEPSDP